MVLVDTTVWVDYFNGQRTSTTDALDDLLSSTVVLVGDLILAEVLQCFRHDRDSAPRNGSSSSWKFALRAIRRSR